VHEPQEAARLTTGRQFAAVLVRLARAVHPHAAAKAAEGRQGDGALEKSLVRRATNLRTRRRRRVVQIIGIQHSVARVLRAKSRQAMPRIAGVCEHRERDVQQHQVVPLSEAIRLRAVWRCRLRLNPPLSIERRQLAHNVLTPVIVAHALHAAVGLRLAPGDGRAHSSRGLALALLQNHACVASCLINDAGEVPIRATRQLAHVHVDAVQHADWTGNAGWVRGAAQLAHDAGLAHVEVTGLQKLSWCHIAAAQQAQTGQVCQCAEAQVPQAPVPLPCLLQSAVVRDSSVHVMRSVEKIQSPLVTGCEQHATGMDKQHAMGATALRRRVKVNRGSVIEC
jgi:hypothetical protein